MSSTNAGDTGHERQADDFYETEAWVTRAILPYLPGDREYMDPCAGEGAILDAIVGYRGTQAVRWGIELDANRARLARAKGHSVDTGDCLSTQRWDCGIGGTVITNPPFSHAMEMVQRAIHEVHPTGVVAMLLRLNWLASAARAPFHRVNPADLYILPKRPSFCASITCDKRHSGCGWHVTQEVSAPRPRQCPKCERGSLKVTTSDSIEYAWFVWGAGRGGRWQILAVP